MAVVDSIVVGVVSFLIGTVGILVGARMILDQDAGVGYAAVTALLGAIAWGVTSFFVGWIPVVGIVVMLVVWVGIINYRYPGGWATAVAIGIVAWAVAVGAVYALALLDLVTPDVLGIPGV